MRAIKPLSTQDEKAKDTVAVCMFLKLFTVKEAQCSYSDEINAITAMFTVYLSW